MMIIVNETRDLEENTIASIRHCPYQAMNLLDGYRSHDGQDGYKDYRGI